MAFYKIFDADRTNLPCAASAGRVVAKAQRFSRSPGANVTA
ncbi:hypothetical protein Q7O_004004 [Pectobacterium carotovorum subsp. carotovorum PCCS1]|nr:hypothetical protein [Pectobacterium carotovorum subsp. carotovorum PCCS1]